MLFLFNVVHGWFVASFGSKRQLLVYSGAPYGNGKLGDSIGESHHKSSAQGVRKANTPPMPYANMGSAKKIAKVNFFAPAPFLQGDQNFQEWHFSFTAMYNAVVFLLV